MDGIYEKVKNTVDTVKDKVATTSDNIIGKVDHIIKDAEEFVEDFLESKINEKRTIGIISAPFNKGHSIKGTEQAPCAIKETGFIQKLKDGNFAVEEFGEVPMQATLSLDVGPKKMKNFKQVMEYNKLLSQKVKEVLEKKDLCITLGGDHALTIGTVTGLADLNRNHQVKLIYVDAHADLITGNSSNSKKDMSELIISFLLGREPNRLDGWPSPSLNYNDIVWIGLREVAPSEQVFLDSTPDLLYFDAKDVKCRGIKNIMRSCLEKLNPGPESPLFISFDIDALDPSLAPSTVPTAAGGGLTMEEGKMIVQSAFCTGFLRGLDIAEVNPALGSDSDVKKTAMAAYNLILSIAEKNGTSYQHFK